jgi:predicted DNA binding protein
MVAEIMLWATPIDTSKMCLCVRCFSTCKGTVDIHELGTIHDGTTAPTTVLSERQRAAVTVALELGYYESPRNTTHADITDRLGCEPNTVTEHLQKAEAKFVQTAFDTLGGSRN